jgi:hypothetical protein
VLRFRPLSALLIGLIGLTAPQASAFAADDAPEEDAAEPCAGRGFSTLELAAREMQDAAATLNVMRFDAAWMEVQANLPCVPSVLTPRQAATIHQAYALGAFTNKQLDETRWSFTSVLDVLPNYEVPPSLAPGDDHPLDELLNQARAADSGVPLAVDMPRGASLFFDGKPQVQRPSNRAAVAQVFTDSGALLWAGYVYPSSTFPPPDMPAPPKSSQQKLARWTFLAGGAAAAVAIGTGLGASYLAGQAVDSSEHIRLGPSPAAWEDSQRVVQQANRANTLAVTAQTSAAVAVGLAGFGVVVLW